MRRVIELGPTVLLDRLDEFAKSDRSKSLC
jgi:hypothetical protein